MCAVPLLAAVMTAVQLLYVDRLIGTVVIGSNQTVVTID
jgi:hypothetical protein